ncbi:hypothetical protein E4A47_11780 [Micrococcus flavus]|uniref:Uncharacterized protein n=1 Tax=Micrococcus flavus TaxID=384602 RepID=A0A4Y8WTG8_9MICC|nr:hypothetical protein [Micrococcus flavus]MBB4881696.1 hypothetical protein [Micrococcus flavus]TFH98146.1 hypothetical protein E4A47_11780 [Micrococcus flavus]GGK54127.1 hypothetical protein GCM10007073_21470 [Micrococcus flavus]
MCRAVTCDVCGKTIWAGCGQHIASVKSGVPAGQWCDGRHGPAEQAAAAASAEPRGGFLSRLFGR